MGSLSTEKGGGRLLGRFSCLALIISACALCGCQFPGSASKGGAPDTADLKNPCIVLALPASGPYVPYANKIRKGANLAKNDLQARGVNLRLENVNTQSPDWLKTLEALPPMCAVVGGPLQEKSYVAARKAGVLDRRVFFSFTPALQKGDEGVHAWRFFPSQQDQIDALVGFVTDDLNIHSFGSFYPTDSYGPRMTDMLEKSLNAKHIPLQKASYNPAAPATWSSAVEPLIQPTMLANKIPVPQTKFEALFLPDSWKHMDMITTSLMYNGEDRLVLMGTTLWEASLNGKQIPKAGRYSLAIFPGAWNASRAPKNLQTPGNDFWVALGFDFINFAVNTGIVNRLENADITARAQRSANVIRGMAPINWDNAGIAHQKLYIFQVGPSGMRPINAESFKSARSAVMEQAALRMQGLPSAVDDGIVGNPVSAIVTDEPSVSAPAAASSPAPEAVPQPRPSPVLPSNQIMSPVPQPSYKLRLPSR